MTIRKRYILFVVSLLAASSYMALTEKQAVGQTQQQPLAAKNLKTVQPTSTAGAFLASHFAQSQYDWGAANDYLDAVLARDPQNPDLLKRAMILATGAGQLDVAGARARELIKTEPGNGLALLIVTVSSLAANNITEAKEALDKMAPGDVTDFIRPILKGWVAASSGTFDTTGLNATAIHSYSGALIALYLKKNDEALKLTRRILESGSITPFDASRAADLFAALGMKEEALPLYEGSAAQNKGNPTLEAKIKALKNNDQEKLKSLLQPLQVHSPATGAAVALFDMAYLLYQENSDASAKLFAQMALALDPEDVEARLLLADTLARNGRYDDAIAYFSNIPSSHPLYLDVQRQIADLYEQSGRRVEALALLNKLFTEQKDVQSLIRIGDIYREDESYADALKSYNRAVQALDGKVPEEYWYLLYARGMAYERLGQWSQAEQDLKAALVYRPDHPYLLNYLGYAWADQGINLDEALKLIERAVALKPTDGYITDSLGWVQYRMGRMKDALPNLEKAVELMPYDTTVNDHLGDVYWQSGRHLEARFQWERAMNSTTDDKEKETISDKLKNGAPPPPPLRDLKSSIVDTPGAVPVEKAQ